MDALDKQTRKVTTMSDQELTTLPVTGTRLLIKDAMIMLNETASSPEWPFVVVAPGDYVVSICDVDGAGRQVRVCAVAAEPERGSQVGAVAVDHGAVAICDYDALLAAVQADLDAYSDWTEEECEEAVWEEESGVLEFGGTRLAHLKTGVGDGTFPVFELRDGSRVVGLECLFAPA